MKPRIVRWLVVISYRYEVLASFNLYAPQVGEHRPLGTRLDYLRAMREAGVARFVATVWSPPA